MLNNQDKIAQLEARQAKEREKLEIEIAIANSLPSGCPDNYMVHPNNLYGRIGSVAFSCPTWPKDESLTYRQLPDLLAMFPALPLVKPVSGSTFTTFMPECLTDHYDSNVKGWENTGRYIFELSEFNNVLTWFTQLDMGIVEINVTLPSQNMIYYWNAKPRAVKYPDWKYEISDRFVSTIEFVTYAKVTYDGKNNIIVFHRDGLDPFQMFDFE
jgi:hypothetical protein